LQQGIMSKPHLKIVEILNSLNIEHKVEFVIGPWTFDVFIPPHNILIEVQGTYWHTKKDRLPRDKAKQSYIQDNFPQYQLKHIWEHECLEENKVLEKIKYWLGITKLELVDFDLNSVIIKSSDKTEADTFLYNWHYIHYGQHGISMGAYLGNELIALARFTSPHRQEIAISIGYQPKEVLELSRLVVHPRYQKKNLLSWFLSRVEKQLPQGTKCLVSFADTSYGHTGAVYKASNWQQVSVAKPNYYYVDNEGWVMHKRTLWDHAKKMQMTENEYMNKFNYRKVWGKEKYKFIKILSK